MENEIKKRLEILHKNLQDNSQIVEEQKSRTFKLYDYEIDDLVEFMNCFLYD